MSRVRRHFVVVLCLLWTAALACACAVPEPAMHCQVGHMPCCPASGHSDAHCSAIRCAPQIFQKPEAPQAAHSPASAAGLLLPVVRRTATPLRELLSGLSRPFSVFRLKDDLRI